jgi:hypothetical protein
LHVYVFSGLVSLFPKNSGTSRRMVVIGAGIALWLIFLLGRVYGGNTYGWPSIALEIAGMQWMGSVFLLAVGLFAADLARGFGLLFSGAATRLRTLGLTCGLVMAMMAHIQGFRPPEIETYEVIVDGLPAHLDHTTIAVMSDFHAGEILLSNQWEMLTDGLMMAGIDDLTTSRRNSPKEGETNLAKALADRPAGATLLLSHTPWLTDRAAAAGVDLMISGHTHNGQIWPFNYIVRTRYPFISGSYDIGGMTLIVSRGTGTWGPRMRLWAPGEISFITLRTSMPGR